MSKKPGAASKRAAGNRVMFNRDSAPLKLSGWAAPVADAGAELALSLMAGSVRLGTLRRDRKRPDVDKFLGYEGPPAGFRIDDFGLAAFAEITGFSDFAIEVSQDDGAPARHPLLLGDGSDVAEPLGSRRGIRKSVRLADLWFDAHRKLTLRFEGAETTARRVDAYQCIPGGEPMLIQVGPAKSVGGAIFTATFTLPNPFLPVLLLFSGEDGALDAIDLLPFPSLVRGGRHAAERLITGNGGDEVGEAASVSAKLLQRLRHRAGNRANHVSTVEIDSAVATGLEPSVDEDMLAWLGDGLGLHLRFESDRAGVPRFIAERANAHSKHTKAGHKLQLPADAIPTIASLVSPCPAASEGQAVCGGFAVVDWNRHGRIWSVWQPPVAEWLNGFQFGKAARFAPILSLSGGEHDAQPDRPLAPDWPLAIIFRQQPTRIEGAMPLETSADLPLPLIRSGALPAAEPLSAIILFDERNSSPVALLESLARQEAIGPVQVTLCWPEGRDSAAASAALETLFGDRQLLLKLPPRSSAVEQLVAAREGVETADALILEADVLLSDPRTLATLLAMLAPQQVLTAGCLLRNGEGKAAVAIGAGYSLTGLDLRTTPTLAFDSIDPAVFRQPVTYPVVANSMAVMAVKASLLASLDPSGSIPFRREADELMLGVHAIQRDGINLCTTIVSAYSADGAAKRGVRPTSIPYQLSPQTVAAVAQSAIVVQRIR
jgi:hypothetical protein